MGFKQDENNDKIINKEKCKRIYIYIYSIKVCSCNCWETQKIRQYNANLVSCPTFKTMELNSLFMSLTSMKLYIIQNKHKL